MFTIMSFVTIGKLTRQPVVSILRILCLCVLLHIDKFKYEKLNAFVYFWHVELLSTCVISATSSFMQQVSNPASWANISYCTQSCHWMFYDCNLQGKWTKSSGNIQPEDGYDVIHNRPVQDIHIAVIQQ